MNKDLIKEIKITEKIIKRICQAKMIDTLFYLIFLIFFIIAKLIFII